MPKNLSCRILCILFALGVCASLLPAQNTLSFGQASVSLVCAKGAAVCNPSLVGLTDSNAGPDYFAITAATVPYWLQVSPMSGSATTSSQNLTFQPSPAAASLAVGLYSASVQFTGPNLVTASLTVSFDVTDSGATGITVQQGSTYTTSWQMGTAFPSLSLTIYSNTTVPVPFTCTIASNPTQVGVSNWLTPAAVQSIAYSWGTTIPLTVNPTAYGQAVPGETLTATATIAYGAASSKTVTINITAAPAAASISSFNPSSVPVLGGGLAGNVTIAINGNNFSQLAPVTKVFTGSGANVTLCAGCTVHVLNSQNMTVAIPYDSTGAPFKTAGSLTIGVANGANPAAPQNTKTLTITTAPIINSVTSASSFIEPVLGADPIVAPFDVISVFGSNFCPTSLAACATPIVGTPDAYFRYPTWLSPDPNIAAPALPHKLTVMFSKTAAGNPAWANVPAYLLFANNNQINALVPAAVLAQAGAGVATAKIVVAFDNSATAATAPAGANSSAPYLLNVAAVDPGAFTLDSSGQGAILDAQTFALNTSSAPAVGGTSSVAIYVTGLGIPDSTGTNAPQLGYNPPTTCLAAFGNAGTNAAAPTGYLGTVNTSVNGGGYVVPNGYVPPAGGWNTIDGAIVRWMLLSLNVNPPCFGQVANDLPVVTIGGSPATVQYAGFVADAIAGLYQINVAVPNIGNGVAAQYPVLITTGSNMGGVPAPPVKIWVQ